MSNDTPFLDDFEPPPPKAFKEKRRGADLLALSARTFALAGWVVLVSALLAIENAQPPVATLFDRFLSMQLRQERDPDWVAAAVALLVMVMMTSAIGLAANRQRLRRKGDRYSRSLILQLLLSVLILALASFWS